METIKYFWEILNTTVAVIGWVTAFILLASFVLALFAWFKGVLKPIYRLGLGLSRKKITVVAGIEDCESLINLVQNSRIFGTTITKICSREDAEDIRRADVILFKYSGSPFTLSEVLNKKNPEASIVIYAKPGEIREPTEWSLMDEYRNISVCNLKGRLLNDLLTLMMTTKL